MNRRITRLVTCFVLASLCLPALGQVSKVRVGFCAKTISSGAAPFAIATRMGWFKEDGIEVTVVPLAGSSDCVKSVTTKQIPFALAAVEPKAVARLQGIKTRTFYTAYQGNIYQLAVPADSSIQESAILEGRQLV